MLPTEIDQCPAQLTSFFTPSPSLATSPAVTGAYLMTRQREGAEKIFGIAYLLVPPICCSISLVIGCLTSLLTGGHKSIKTVNPHYLSEYAWYIWPKAWLPIRPLDHGPNFATTPTDYDHRFNSLSMVKDSAAMTHSNLDYPISSEQQFVERSIVGDQHKRSKFRKQNGINFDEHQDQDLKCLKYKLVGDDDRLPADANVTPVTADSSLSTSSNSAV